MKTLVSIIASAAIAVSAQAAVVGWSVATGSTTYGGNKYALFVIGQNGVTSVEQIQTLLSGAEAAKWSDYAFAAGELGGNGAVSVSTTSPSAKTITPSSYPATVASFAVVFDSASPASGSKFVIIADQANQTKTLANASVASITLATGNASSIVSNSSNWKSYGPVPEPTTVALLALGLAALGLKRKVA